LSSRRRFLLGGLGGAIAVIGGTGVAGATHRGRRLLHAAGVLDRDGNAAPPVAGGGRIEYRTLASSAMRAPVSYAVASPAPDAPVVYALHGRGQDETFAVEHIRLQAFLADAGVVATVVSADGGASSYWHPRRTGADPLGMLVRELVPQVESTMGNGRRAVIGWSMGGYGALLAAERFPDLFPVVVATAPALWRSASETAPGAFDGPLDFKAHDVFTATDRLDGAAVRIDCGRDDPFAGAIEAFAALVPAAELHIGRGFHDAATWRRMAPGQAAFLGRHLL
jgi:S-formylglutathione hydrolase FrmB